MTVEDMQKLVEQLKAAQHKHEAACPNCGYCPTCGRSNSSPYPYNPYGPVWTCNSSTVADSSQAVL